MRVIQSRILYLACAALLIVSIPTVSAQTQSRIAEAREKLEQVAGVLEQANTARGQGDQEAWSAHQQRADDLLHEAVDLFSAGNAMYSGDPEVLSDYGNALYRTGNFDLAAKAYRAVTHEAPNRASAWLYLGRSLLRRGQLDAESLRETKTALEEALALQTEREGRLQTLLEMGKLYEEAGLPTFARERYEEVLADDPEQPAALISMAALDVRNGDVETAITRLEALGPALAGYTPEIRNQFQDALAAFNDARGWFPDTAAAHLAFAKVLVQAGEMNRASYPLERSLELDSENYVAWNLLGSISRGTGDVERARQAFTRSLEINPDQPRTREALNALPNPNQ